MPRRSPYVELAPDVPLRIRRGIDTSLRTLLASVTSSPHCAATSYSPIFDGPPAATKRLATQFGIASDHCMRRVTIATPAREALDFTLDLMTNQL